MSFPTLTDLAFYQWHTRPAWAGRIRLRPQQIERPPSIDSVVNLHGPPERLDTESHNMCAMARSWQRRGELEAQLSTLVLNPQGPRPEKRKALARKWLARIVAKPKPCAVPVPTCRGRR